MRSTRRSTAVAALTAGLLAATAPQASSSDQLTVERIDGDGVSQFKVQTRLPTGWETRVGMDLGVATRDGKDFRPGTIEPWKASPGPSALAWGTLVMPGPGTALGWDETRLDARLNAVAEEFRVTATAVRRWTVGPHLNASAIGNLAVTETGIVAGDRLQQWETSRALRLTVVPTGTSIETRALYAGAEEDWHASVSAEQSLFGNMSLNASVGEIETGDPTLSVGTRFRRRW